MFTGSHRAAVRAPQMEEKKDPLGRRIGTDTHQGEQGLRVNDEFQVTGMG